VCSADGFHDVVRRHVPDLHDVHFRVLKNPCSEHPCSEFLQAKNAVNSGQAELDEAKTRMGEDRAGTGRFFHGGRLESARKLENEALRDFDTTSASLAERERDRMSAVLPQALSYGAQQANFPLTQAAALQQYGSLPREIEQADKTALYNEFMRTEDQTREDLALSSSFAGPVPYAYPQYQESELMRLLKAAIPAAGSVLGAKL
jgi:hypothetical protein